MGRIIRRGSIRGAKERVLVEHRGGRIETAISKYYNSISIAHHGMADGSLAESPAKKMTANRRNERVKKVRTTVRH